MKKLSGIYLVIDPSMSGDLLVKLSQALKGGLGLIQIWNHWPNEFDRSQKRTLVTKIKHLAQKHEVPVLMNEDWQLCVDMHLDGVHFDEAPTNWPEVRKVLSKKIIGLTVGNDLEKIKWASEERFSYLSFCAVFPSPSVASCEIVTPEVVEKTRSITTAPLFLSGGIRPENLMSLKGLDFQGVAVISGIMSSSNPEEAVNRYNEKLLELRNHQRS